MPVTVRRDRKRAVISWGSPEPSNWKTLGSPLSARPAFGEAMS
jgi:hypothetical protein